MMSRRIGWLNTYALLLVFSFSFSSWAQGHALLHEVKATQSAMIVHFFYEGVREKPWFEQYVVYAPDEELSFQEGRVNELGEVTFRPHRPGHWRVQVITSDGHAQTANIQVLPEDATADLTAIQSSSGSVTRLVTVIGYLLGLFGLLMLWRNRNAWHQRER
jgi:nickel transport protein